MDKSKINFILTNLVLLILGSLILFFNNIFNNNQKLILLIIWAITYISLSIRTLIAHTLATIISTYNMFFIFFLGTNINNLLSYKTKLILVVGCIATFLLMSEKTKSFCINNQYKEEERIGMSIPKSIFITTTIIGLLITFISTKQFFPFHNISKNIIGNVIVIIACIILFYFNFILLLSFSKRMIIFVPRGLVVIDNINFLAPVRIEKAELSFEIPGNNFVEEYATNEKTFKDLTLGCKNKCYMINVEHALVESKSDGIKIDSLYISLDKQIG